MEGRNRLVDGDDNGGGYSTESLNVTLEEVEVRKEKMLTMRRQELNEVMDRHDDLVREAFHLEKFVTLLGYDPKVAKQEKSNVFEEFRRSYDLLRKTSNIGSSSRSTRRAVTGRQELLTTPQASLSQAVGSTPATPIKGKGKANQVQDNPSPSKAAPQKTNAGVNNGPVTPKGKKAVGRLPGRPRARTPPTKSRSSSPRPEAQDTPSRPPKHVRQPKTPRNSHIWIPATPKATRSSRSIPTTPATFNRKAAGTKHKADDPPPETPRTLKRIKLVHRPRAEYSDPRQIPFPPQYGRSLPKLLESFFLLDDDKEIPVEELHRLELRAERDAKLRNRIEALRASGAFAYHEHKVDVKPPDEPKRPIGHQDHLLADMVLMSKYIREEGRAKIAGAKRIAKMVEKHFDRIANADSREQKAEEKRKAILVRTTMREVVKEWRLAVAVVRARRKDEQQAEKIRKGKIHLDAFLEQSTQVLEAQHADLATGAERRRRTKSRSESRSSQGPSGWGSHSERSVSREDEDDESRIDEELSMFGSESDQEVEVVSDTLEDPLNLNSPPSDDDDEAGYIPFESPSYSFQFDVSRASDGTKSVAPPESHGRYEPSSPLLLGQPEEDDVDFIGVDEDDSFGMDHQLDAEMEKEDEDMSDGSEMDELEKDANIPIKEVLEGYGVPPARADDAPEPHTPDPLEQLSTPTPSLTSGRRRPSRKVVVTSTSALSPLREHDAQAGDIEFEEPDIDELTKADHEMDVEMEAAESDGSDGSEVDGLAKDADIPIEELLRQYGYEMGPEDGGGDEQGEVVSEGMDVVAEPLDESEHEPQTFLSLPVVEEDQASSSRESTPDPETALSPAEESEEVEESEDDDNNDEDEDDDDDDEGMETSSIRMQSPNAEDKVDGLHVPPPFLLRGTLRPYQQAGLEWLASLHANNTNGILADEMGLGKTIQTISLLGYLACSKGNWGPHLIIVPTSVLLNWEMEFKRFLPGFKTVPYYGTPKERAKRRQGWNTEHSFNVCITSYQLALADQQIFRRKKWEYMVLDEAHNIKNFKSKRWETLLCFNAGHRLLLTGTPLQNNLMELWSLLYFLMPDEGLAKGDAETQSFVRREDFKDLFQNPVERAIEDGRSMNVETRDTVHKLHTLLRPYLLRRLKSEVEKQLPSKHEHLVYCRLSKRQRFLYDEFMSRAATKETLASGNYLSIVNCLMQLRKVCNHPDLFEVRPIVTSFAMSRSAVADYEIKELLIRRRLLNSDLTESVNLEFLGLQFAQTMGNSLLAARSTRMLDASSRLPHINNVPGEPPPVDLRTIAGFKARQKWQRGADTISKWQHISYINRHRCSNQPVYSSELLRIIKTLWKPLLPLSVVERDARQFLKRVDTTHSIIKTHSERLESMSSTIDRFVFATPRVIAHGLNSTALTSNGVRALSSYVHDLEFDSLHPPAVKLQIAFPDASLLQFDCGKLQELATLLRDRNSGGHRVLIFTQMTKVLDILEIFLNYHGYRYLRLDGATKIEQRQIITERFNLDSKIFAFIASSRSGGIGINLTGADTVIFYDSDYNPSMDRQCEDRAHRIGQTREVHIYRFISEHTVEESMLRKANQKRSLDDMVIQKGEFDWRKMLALDDFQLEEALAVVEDKEDAEAAKVAKGEIELDETDFTETVAPKEDGISGVEMAGGNDDEQAPEQQEAGSADVDDGIGSITDYMLRVVERDWMYFGHERPYTSVK